MGRGTRAGVIVGAVAFALSACAPAVKTARLDDVAPPSPREIEAAERLASPACSANLGFLFPGAAQFCYRKPAEGAALSALAAAEIATAVTAGAVQTTDDSALESPGVQLTLVSLQNLWVIGYGDAILDQDRARQLPYTPQDTLGELAWAPFNWRVMKKPAVWGGLALTLAAGVGVSLLIDDDLDADPGGDVNLFGRPTSPVLGYAAGGAALAGTFAHVAVGEEILFRGVVQSRLARSYGETTGWVAGSLLFGAAHAPNALVLDGADRTRYLAVGLPFITVIGSYLGKLYQWDDYSLTGPVALHFWYDFLLSATFFALDPEDSLVSARIAVPF